MSSLWELRDDRLVEVILNLPGAADLGYDVTRKRLLVPLTGSSRVEVYDLRSDPRQAAGGGVSPSAGPSSRYSRSARSQSSISPLGPPPRSRYSS